MTKFSDNLNRGVRMGELKKAALFCAVVLTFAACDSGAPVPTASPEGKGDPKPPGVEESTPPSPWHVSKSRNEVTGEETVTASTGFGEQGIVIRRIGNKLECFFTTGQFLETLENMRSGISTVAYRFDDGPVVRQGWGLSAYNEALFYPGNPSAFLIKMRKAKRLAIEYKPADVVPQTVSFDISQFPLEFSPKEPKSK